MNFQQHQGQDAPKAVLSADLSANVTEETLQTIFCMAHGAFVQSPGVDIDHSYAFTKIRQNQVDLFKFLNKHEKFAQMFLSQPGMSDFCRRDDDGQIKGTGYFYKMSYNAISNLWLICHSCNVIKGSQEALLWFEKQKLFGPRFVEYVNGLGGVNEGVIINKVYEVKESNLILEIEGRLVILHRDAKGLGVIVREWFFKEYKEIYEVEKQYYRENYQTFKSAINEIRATIEEHDEPRSDEIARSFSNLRKALSRLDEIFKKMQDYQKVLSSSDGSDEGSLTSEMMPHVRTENAKRMIFHNHWYKGLTLILDQSFKLQYSEKKKALIRQLELIKYDHEELCHLTRNLREIRKEFQEESETASEALYVKYQKAFEESKESHERKMVEGNPLYMARESKSISETIRADEEARLKEEALLKAKQEAERAARLELELAEYKRQSAAQGEKIDNVEEQASAAEEPEAKRQKQENLSEGSVSNLKFM